MTHAATHSLQRRARKQYNHSHTAVTPPERLLAILSSFLQGGHQTDSDTCPCHIRQARTRRLSAPMSTVRVRLSARHKKKDDSGTSQSNLAEVVSASSPIHNTGANKTREPAVDVTTTTHAETL